MVQHLGEYFFEKCSRYSASVAVALYALCPGLRTARGSFVTRVAILAHRPWFPPSGVRPDIGRLHASIAILAVTNGVAKQAFHERHLAELASRILDEPPHRLHLLDKFEGPNCQGHTQPSTVRLWGVVVIPVSTDGSDTKTLARRRCPEHVAVLRLGILSRLKISDVARHVWIELFQQFYGESLMAEGSCNFAKRFGRGKEFYSFQTLSARTCAPLASKAHTQTG